MTPIAGGALPRRHPHDRHEGRRGSGPRQRRLGRRLSRLTRVVRSGDRCRALDGRAHRACVSQRAAQNSSLPSSHSRHRAIATPPRRVDGSSVSDHSHGCSRSTRRWHDESARSCADIGPLRPASRRGSDPTSHPSGRARRCSTLGREVSRSLRRDRELRTRVLLVHWILNVGRASCAQPNRRASTFRGILAGLPRCRAFPRIKPDPLTWQNLESG